MSGGGGEIAVVKINQLLQHLQLNPPTDLLLNEQKKHRLLLQEKTNKPHKQQLQQSMRMPYLNEEQHKVPEVKGQVKEQVKEAA